MPAPKRKIHKALWGTKDSIQLLLSEPWTSPNLPRIELNGQAVDLQVASPEEAARFTGYFLDNEEVVFVLHAQRYPRTDINNATAFVAGSFNNWQAVLGDSMWKLKPIDLESWHLRLPLNLFDRNKPNSFKFITGDGHWLEPPATAPNRHSPWKGVSNLRLDLDAQGRQMLHFKIPEIGDLGADRTISWLEPDYSESCQIPRQTLLPTLRSSKVLGATLTKDGTTFRLFAPRAESVTVKFWQLSQPSNKSQLQLKKDIDGTWSANFPENLDGFHYHYKVCGTNLDATTAFDAQEPLNDPYAIALASASGPGIVKFARPAIRQHFAKKKKEDLQIVEVHLRDLLAEAPIELSGTERRGFTGLAKWLRTGDTYFHNLGINAVELLPVHEFDCESPHEYHWGYMPVNLFAPASTYAEYPATGSQIEEFQDLVQAFHEQGFSVILDVVLNHQGIYTPLHGIDKGYYFEMDDSQELLNWSGCGNDIRADAPMVQRLLVDSLLHWVRTYDVDGFRLDLAELLGLETLKAIENALRKEKSDIHLIAEPWSFRGHIAKTLRSTSYTSWNDGFREFTYRYVLGDGSSKELAYYLGGSSERFATFPAQTLNYIESHDDRCWIDKITENAGHDGRNPTPIDIRRTHLAVAILNAALGIPMLAGGIEFLRSKHGINNTYQRGDLNVLDYNREKTFADSVQYIRNWVKFRNSPEASLLRREEFPKPDQLKFYYGKHGNALTMHHQEGEQHLLFSINPSTSEVETPLPDGLPKLRLIADEMTFHQTNAHPSAMHKLPKQSLRLWINQ